MNKNKVLNIGLIQTTLDSSIAWNSELRMNEFEAKRVWQEIKNGIVNLNIVSPTIKPEIIILPEFALPLEYENDLVQISKTTGCIFIAGLDFIKSEQDEEKFIENKAVVIIPNSWSTGKRSVYASKVYFGKYFFSNLELKAFESKFTKKPNENMYIFDAGLFGNIGVAICADFFDIERFEVYKGRIHHMIVIAYNQDVNSFYFLAEAISRLVFCNVVICNTGYFGGSIVFSPYEKTYKRYVYKHEGSKLFTSQILSLPVEELDEFQRNIGLSLDDKNRKFKSLPPNYKQIELKTTSEN